MATLRTGLVTVIVLVVSILSFLGVVNQSLPVVLTETKTETFIRFQVASEPTLVRVVGSSQYTTQQLVGYNYYYNPDPNCGGFQCGGEYEEPIYETFTYTSAWTNMKWSTATVSYGYTATSFLPISSTSLESVPIALGLNPSLFTALAYIVISTLALLSS